MSYMPWITVDDCTTDRPELERRFWQSVDICGSIDPHTSLASLHANPWCSAMRRSRHLDAAQRRMIDREFDTPRWPIWGAFSDAYWDHAKALGAACRHEMESVR